MSETLSSGQKDRDPEGRFCHHPRPAGHTRGAFRANPSAHALLLGPPEGVSGLLPGDGRRESQVARPKFSAFLVRGPLRHFLGQAAKMSREWQRPSSAPPRARLPHASTGCYVRALPHGTGDIKDAAGLPDSSAASLRRGVREVTELPRDRSSPRNPSKMCRPPRKMETLAWRLRRRGCLRKAKPFGKHPRMPQAPEPCWPRWKPQQDVSG